ncbi:MAG TPA: lipopolysaccharide heptosyltransferase II [Syntrophales bacterium]|nr:lipopolysaccharide heptosyltransferase II [Syntrophales bacterium]HOX93657.1 lipopolysaccharide heptosyltransferase II [Syntrophales bacterium]HPI57381.1 lipopolysaccharide heptosyltransferase II [Syntrophales bacterium]HPN25445.1 lipopolysaccharide heptosyltransferase II [Syntrophales bacterium]HQM29927.1 lipopolysaccharide heptosyltransferase II [Syntrophales bacterium]
MFQAKPIPREGVRNILIRGTNWIGDVVMTLPAIAAVREAYPGAKISILVKPWVADLLRISSDVDEVLIYERPGVHEGLGGFLRLVGELKARKFDMAILLQNAIEAAIIAWLARIPVRAGYSTDGRGFLLTHAVRRTDDILRLHQTRYYLEMLKALGLEPGRKDVRLAVGEEEKSLSDRILKERGIAPDSLLIGLAPGATYGPAKMWYPERFASVADRLIERFSARVLIFGSGGDHEVARRVRERAGNTLIDLTGETTLREAISLIARCRLFVSNDSGLMHVAGALGIPTVAIFGSTNPLTTSPVGQESVVITKNAPCAPCLKETCPTDFICMDLITVDDVYDTAVSLLTKEL